MSNKSTEQMQAEAEAIYDGRLGPCPRPKVIATLDTDMPRRIANLEAENKRLREALEWVRDVNTGLPLDRIDLRMTLSDIRNRAHQTLAANKET